MIWITESEGEEEEEPARRSSSELGVVEDVVKPLESRMQSAERYYGPQVVDGEEEGVDDEQTQSKTTTDG